MLAVTCINYLGHVCYPGQMSQPVKQNIQELILC